MEIDERKRLHVLTKDGEWHTDLILNTDLPIEGRKTKSKKGKGRVIDIDTDAVIVVQ